MAGASTGGSAGAAAGAGSGGTTPTVYEPPGMGETWPIESGDPLNATVPALVALDDGGVMIAGASADPATVGVTAFDTGIMSEAFVARLGADGAPVWARPLTEAGLPWAMRRSGDDVVIVAPYLPDLAEVSTSYVSKDVYLAKIGLDGTPRFETTVEFDNEITYTYGLAIGAAGDIYLAGGVQNSDMVRGILSSPILVRCTADGTKVWESMPEHTGTQGYANDVAVLSSGDVVMTGAFDLDMTFGSLSPITSTALLMGLPNGFVVRYTEDGEPVWADQFGGEDFSVGTGLSPLGDDDFLLSGGAALDLNLGGTSLPGEPFVPDDMSTFPPMAAFVARLAGDGVAEWVTLEQPATYGSGVELSGATVLLAGDMEDGAMTGGFAYVRTYDVATGESVQNVTAVSGTDIESAFIAPGAGHLWVSGRFSGNTDFGNENILDSGAGVYLLRLGAE